ncbi:MAG TPA: hypothetical protein VKP04_06845 [Ktedonobacteraceae bacterium]|nr:hypothetical protein [Ktedonobacteraceae bacterium]
MDLSESNSQSFIVKVWVEDNAEEIGKAVWHGHITHVPDGQRRYLKNLGEIEDFIAPHLEAMGAQLGTRWRLRRWLKRLMGRS